MASLPPVRRRHFAVAGIVTLALVIVGILGGSGLLTAGIQQSSRSATVLPNVTMIAGDQFSVYGNACSPHAGNPGNPIIMTCGLSSPTPSPSATAGVATPTATSAVVTGTATPPFRGLFGLSIRLDSGDPLTLAGWNAHALAIDGEHSQGANAALLLSAKGNDRSVECGGAAVLADQCAAAIAFAVKAGITDVGVNDEGPPCATLQSDEAAVYAKVKAAGLTMEFAPVGTMLHACPVDAFTTNTDRLIYQVEALENDPKYSFAQYVHDEIAALHAVRPGLPIICQVSVNPSHNRLATAQQVLADIAALEDGSVNAPAGIAVFYSKRAGDLTSPQRADVMLAVQQALRP